MFCVTRWQGIYNYSLLFQKKLSLLLLLFIIVVGPSIHKCQTVEIMTMIITINKTKELFILFINVPWIYETLRLRSLLNKEKFYVCEELESELKLIYHK